MRDNFIFNMIPIVQDNMNYLPGVKTLTSLSSNGYYGYQPPLERSKEGALEDSICMEVQFENGMVNNRKRCWEYQDSFREFKKRRQNEKIKIAIKKKVEAKEDFFEELLSKTHGSAIYHWNCDT